ncbi:uncharacterized protein LOC128891497 [Hylaeus anthracinus]|uniref:uncharacterized protein LOC128891497 n=1 Tax=Hylaeus anthracinus TaxID=313031 RepID=UPI0023B8EA35|nr:uncharacterized protein LOC128891497 [Hylaeus anthracinus]
MVCFRFSLVRSDFLNLIPFYVALATLFAQPWLSYCYYNRNSNSNVSKPVFSTPEECARTCVDGEPPKYCYYHFHIEFYTVYGPACDKQAQMDQCVLADMVERTFTSINRQLPGPIIEVCKGDYIIVDVENATPGTEITIHWHGLFQNGYQYYDGVPYVTQCPIPSSSTFRYQFQLQNAGTHFYHSHISTFMSDGQYGALIGKDPKDPHRRLYDVDKYIVLLSDWFHSLSLERYPGFYRHDLGQDAQNILINGRGKWTDPVTKQTNKAPLTVFEVEQGKRYRFRIINSFSTVCLAEYRIENHNCTVIAQDGANVKPTVVDAAITSAGERLDCVIHADQKPRSYWIQVRGLGECAEKKVQQFAILKYKGALETPPTPQPSFDNPPKGIMYNPLDGSNCGTRDTSNSVCVNQLESLEDESEILQYEPDEFYILDFWFYNYTDYGDRNLFQKKDSYPTYFSANDRSQLTSMFNDVTYLSSSSPLISDRRSYETICKPNQLSNCVEPCVCTQVIHTQLGNVVELLIYDRIPQADLHHPFHIHGYEFKVLYIGQFTDGRNISQTDVDNVIMEHQQRLKQGVYKNPPGKDTVKIPVGGYAFLRFKADNPGWWLLHCHFTWHHVTGMELVIHVGDRRDLPRVPSDFPECSNWKPPFQSLNDFYGDRHRQC